MPSTSSGAVNESSVATTSNSSDASWEDAMMHSGFDDASGSSSATATSDEACSSSQALSQASDDTIVGADTSNDANLMDVDDDDDNDGAD